MLPPKLRVCYAFFCEASPAARHAVPVVWPCLHYPEASCHRRIISASNSVRAEDL